MREYTLIDSDTGLIYGPYESRAEAETYAETYDLSVWEMFDGEDRMVAWSRKPDPQAEQERSQRKRAA